MLPLDLRMILRLKILPFFEYLCILALQVRMPNLTECSHKDCIYYNLGKNLIQIAVACLKVNYIILLV